MATLAERLQAWRTRRAELLALRQQYDTALQAYLQAKAQLEAKAQELAQAEGDLAQP